LESKVPSPLLGIPEDQIQLLSLLNLDNLIGNQAMRFSMDGIRSLLAGRFDQTKDFAGALVKPVAQVFDPVLFLSFQVSLMGAAHGFRRQAFDVLVNIHK
jgi:hypothetical protein